MQDDFVVFAASDARDPDGSRLRGALQAHVAFERARAIRETVVYLLAGVSVLVWLSAVWPSWVSPGFRTFSLASWALAFIGLLLAAGSELGWHHKRAALTEEVSSGTSSLAPPGAAKQSDR